MSYLRIVPPAAVDQFRDAIAKLGLVPPPTVIADGKIHRFSSNGKRGDDSGWYSFHDDAIAHGSFGDFRTAQTVRAWVADLGRELSPVEKTNFALKQAEQKSKREADTIEARAEAKKKAEGILRYSRPAPEDHPYLVRKNVQPHGILSWKDMLVVPMKDESGEVQTVQLIGPDGSKKFLTGGKTQGCYHTLGNLNESNIVLIAEGYATGATIREVTGHPTVIAFNANNLLAIAKLIRSQKPDATIIVCGDDDYQTKGNPGMLKATDAACATGSLLLLPEFGNERPKGATDFNDMQAYCGKDAVTNFFTRRFSGKENDSTHTNNEPEQEAYLSRPAAASLKQAPIPETERLNTVRTEREAAAAPKHPAAARSAPPSEPVIELKAHFSGEEFEAVQRIWKSVNRQVAQHSETGYDLLIDENRKVKITKDCVQFSRKARHRPDAAYAAVCEHARHFWNGQMEVHGDIAHCIKAWAYAQAQGIKVTNYAPSDADLIEANKILKCLGKILEPGFRRPVATLQSGGRQSIRPKV